MQEKKNKVIKTYLSILILIIGFIVVLSYILPTVYEMNLKKEKQVLEDQVLQTNNFVEMEKEFNSLLTAVENREKEGKFLSEKYYNIMDIVNAIESAVPEKLFIQQFEASGENIADLEISLKGTAGNEEIIASFIRNLMVGDYFEKVKLAGVANKLGLLGSSFDITLSGVGNNRLLEYESWENGFKIGYPSDWIIKEEAINNVEFAAVKSITSARPPSLTVSVDKTEKDLEGFVEHRKEQLKKDLKDFVLEYSKPVKSSNQKAYRLLYNADEDDVKYQYLELLVIYNSKSYKVTYKSDYNNFSNKARTIDIILSSFVLNK